MKIAPLALFSLGVFGVVIVMALFAALLIVVFGVTVGLAP